MKLRKNNLTAYFVYLQKEGKSVATVARAIAAVRGFYEYLALSGVVKRDPAAGIPVPKPEKRLPGILTVHEIEVFLDQPDLSSTKGCRDKAMLELMYATGLKVSELIALKLGDVDFNTGLIRCVSGGTERIVPFGSVSSDALKKYIELSVYHRSKNPDMLLFTNLYGKQMSRQGFWKIIKQYKAQAGIAKEITPQVLRHSFAAHLIDNGLDTSALQELMGYTAASSAQFYANLSGAHIKEIYKKAHPRA
jgi:integrase/recombinase XerD